MGKGRVIRIVVDTSELYRAAAEEFVRLAEEGVGRRGIFTVALAGGKTPQGLYSLLAEDASFRDRVRWEKVHFFFGDERHVPPDHPDNNYRMAYQALLSRIPAPAWNAHRMATELEDANQVAEYCETILRKFFRLGPGELPRFDLVLLGMGADGHTASLFPGSGAVNEGTRLAVAPWIESLKARRVTLTPPVLNHARVVIFLVSGPGKAKVLREVLEGDFHPSRFPAQAIQPTDGTLLWLVDREAARLLSPGLPRER